MNLTMTTDNLAKAVAEVKPSVVTRGSLPALQNFILEAREGTLMVGGTNLERSAHRLVVAGVDEFGATCVPAKPFFAYTKLLPKGQPVTLVGEDGRLTLTCGPSTATFRCLDAADYPNLPGIFDSTPYEAIRDAKIAAAQAETERLAQEEADRVAALPEVFTYAYQVGSRPFESETFDTLLEAVTRWISDNKGETRHEGGGARWPKWIRDKTGAQVVADQGRAEILYDELMHAELTKTVLAMGEEYEGEGEGEDEEDDDAFDELTADFLMGHAASQGDVEEYTIVASAAFAEAERASIAIWRPDLAKPIGPPPGIPVDDGDEIDITFAASAIIGVPIQRQAEQQHATQDEKIEKVRAAVLAKAQPIRVTKNRFGFKPATIEKFFVRAIRAGATVRVSNLIKHEGNLIEYTPVEATEEAYVVRFDGGEPFPINKANVRYLECAC